MSLDFIHKINLVSAVDGVYGADGVVRMVKIWFVLIWCLGWAAAANGLVVLQYHHVSSETPKATSITPELFKQHMAYLEQAKFHIVDMKDLPAMLNGEKPLPNHAVIITFDDGYTSIYEAAFPELKARKWPFTVFVNTQPHDQKSPDFMSWKQLANMQKHGATIANHTDSHAYLIRRRQGESMAQWQARRKQEILFAEKRLRQELGRAPKFFAYPYGEYDQAMQGVLKQLGYLAFGQQSGPIASTSDPQALPRFPFGGQYGDMDDFVLKVNSLPFPLYQIQLATSRGRLLSDPVLAADEGRPVMTVRSPLLSHIKAVTCFASGMGAIPVQQKGSQLIVQAPKELSPGRSRYNCTAPAGGGRFYWVSQAFVRPNSDGDWSHH